MKILALALSILLFTVPDDVNTKVHRGNHGIYYKRWYAIKSLKGIPGEQKYTEISCELETPYLFYVDVDGSGRIEGTCPKFGSIKPYKWNVKNSWTLEMRSGYTWEDKVVEYSIDFSNDHVLQITGPENDTYIFVSDVIRY